MCHDPVPYWMAPSSQLISSEPLVLLACHLEDTSVPGRQALEEYLLFSVQADTAMVTAKITQ